MAHQEQEEFCMSVKAMFPEQFKGKSVLDVGSLDINGNNRKLFEDCHYVGIDLASGDNVDIVTKAHTFKPDIQYDTIISTECFEHDKHYKESLQNIVELLKPGGLLLFTCATENRPEHGTVNSGSPELSPATSYLWPDYYKNLDIQDIRAAINIDEIFIEYKFMINFDTNDLYFWGIKKPEYAEAA